MAILSSSSFVAKAAFVALTFGSAAVAHPHLSARQASPAANVGFHNCEPKIWSPASATTVSSSLVPSDELNLAATNWLSKNFNQTENNSYMSSGYFDAASGVYHHYTAQLVDGLPVVNGVSDVHLDKFGNALAASYAFAHTEKLARRDLDARAADPISASSAVEAYAKAFGLTADAAQLKESAAADATELNQAKVITGATFAQAPIKAEIKLYQTPTSLEKVWSLNVQRPDAWHNAFISVADGSLVGNSNWQTANFWNPESETGKTASASAGTAPASAGTAPVKRRESFGDSVTFGQVHRRQARQGAAAAGAIPRTTYLALPFGAKDLDSTPPVLLTDPFDKDASPLGWHDLGDGNGPLATTVGNNVVAQENSQNLGNPLNNPRPVSSTFDFNSKANDKNQEPPQYVDASVTNMFVLSNLYHDTLYKYGFTEQAGNFQANNNGKGGLAADPVIANAQDGSGTNNANFASPPDGQIGLMRMFVFTATQPQRDGNLENAIPIHELSHGLSNRLTGGPANANCLNNAISGGMGEGWSDFFGVALTASAQETRTTDRPVGNYVLNNANGVRGVPYSTNLQTNPLTFASITRPVQQNDVHGVGTVWNSMLFEAYWNLVDKLGFTPNFKDDAQSGKGNTLMMQYVVQGLALQPCNPNFVQARDAILAAELQLTKGANKCELIKGFAKRGLGLNAKGTAPFVNDNTVPAECQ
ncbi:Fungalysin metallopeptidase-domain-containing protein [Fimicolochytrium jonesii]|uniref:Fungalysin metallopeptidase-domain-containing protein n=1 Tax=Fimicolochytrium jonesii TaxID=1396493 RepID=UPI0022FDF336|nr:Fungalysin metallopeptidase-domain-containing protein [Fimicolochytrium jonesii]KAI8827068.1 Fungalysin metallopeptidase-domain-containing protein [Fimicolochytrium jonesii]